MTRPVTFSRWVRFAINIMILLAIMEMFEGGALEAGLFLLGAWMMWWDMTTLRFADVVRLIVAIAESDE